MMQLVFDIRQGKCCNKFIEITQGQKGGGEKSICGHGCVEIQNKNDEVLECQLVTLS